VCGVKGERSGQLGILRLAMCQVGSVVEQPILCGSVGSSCTDCGDKRVGGGPEVTMNYLSRGPGTCSYDTCGDIKLGGV
jgi:hypothetical protein